jgi:hypothetical protein
MKILDRKNGWQWVAVLECPEGVSFRSFTGELLEMFDWVESTFPKSKIRKLNHIQGWAIDFKTTNDLVIFKLTWGGLAGTKYSKV